MMQTSWRTTPTTPPLTNKQQLPIGDVLPGPFDLLFRRTSATRTGQVAFLLVNMLGRVPTDSTQEPSALQPNDAPEEPLLDAVHRDFERLLGALEPYTHPSNHGSWVHHLSVFLQDASSALAGRQHGACMIVPMCEVYDLCVRCMTYVCFVCCASKHRVQTTCPHRRGHRTRAVGRNPAATSRRPSSTPDPLAAGAG